MDVVPGRLEITNLQVYFCTTRNGGTDSGDTADRDFQWSLTELREVHLRRYNLRRSALEFFLVDQTNYFINFDKEVFVVLCAYSSCRTTAQLVLVLYKHYLIALSNSFFPDTYNTWRTICPKCCACNDLVSPPSCCY